MPDLNEMFHKPLVYAIPGMEQAELKKDITYHRTDDGQELKADFYYPSGFKYDRALPAVIFVHGDGGPEILKNIKDSGTFKGWGQLAAASNFVGITFNHRSSEGFTRMGQVKDDIAALVEMVRERAADFRVDPEHLAIFAFSAGAPFGVSYFLNNPGLFKCLVVYYGLLNLRPLQPYLPETIRAEELAAFSPAYLLEQSADQLPPMLVVKAALDRPDLNSLIDEFVRVSQAQGREMEFWVHTEGQHAFDTLDDNEQSRQFIARTLKFIQNHI